MNHPEIEFQVLLDPQGRVPEGALVYRIRGSANTIRYDNVRDFYFDLLRGRPLPTCLVSDRVPDSAFVVLTALFLHRDLALSDRMPMLVSEAELACWGPSGLAHLTHEQASWYRFLDGYLVQPKLSPPELGRRLKQAVEWLKGYVEGGILPSIPLAQALPKVLDIGTVGFCVAEQEGPDLLGGWIELYRQGFLRGVLFGPGGSCLVARKSSYLAFDLSAARRALEVLGGRWSAEASNGFLWGIGVGSRDDILQVLTRV